MHKLIAFCTGILFLSLNGAHAQNCVALSTSAPSGVTFGYNSGGYQQFGNNTIASVESSEYFFRDHSPSVLNFSYDLNSSSNANPQVNSYTIQLIYRTEAGITVAKTCSGISSFTVSNNAAQPYYFSIPSDNIPANTRFVVQLTLALSNVTNANVIGTGFRLQNTAILLPVESTLPVNFISFTAQREGGYTKLNWQVADEMNVATYEVQRSSDGRQFSSIKTIAATNSNSYSTKETQVNGVIFYRIKNTDLDGRSKYSPVLKIENGNQSIVKKVFPMPARDEIYIQYDALFSASEIMILTVDGQKLESSLIMPGTMQTRIDLSKLTPGVYFLRYITAEGNSEVMKVVKQ